jgi:SagB-type dehydrogenase family enzyme
MKLWNQAYSAILAILIASANCLADDNSDVIDLPSPQSGPERELLEVMRARRSQRDFERAPIKIEQISALLFAGQGITRQERLRTVPSAGALYPLEIYVVAGDVEGLKKGVYRYIPQGHKLERVGGGDRRYQLAEAALGQLWISKAPAILVLGAVYERTAAKYGARAERYADIEAGCCSQNISLACVDLGLGTTVVGAFNDERLAKLLGADDNLSPLIVMPIAHPAK